MNYTEARTRLKPMLADYLQAMGHNVPTRGRTGTCPSCGGGGNTGCFSLQDKERAKCFSCDAGGDIFDWIGHLEGIKEPLEQLKRAAEMFNISLDDKRPDKIEQARRDFAAPIDAQPVIKSEKAEPVKEIPATFFTNPEPGRLYLKGRGISEAVIEAHNVGYDPQKNAVVIPVANGYYFSRSIEGKAFYNPKAEDAPVSIDARPLDQSEPVFIVEGQIDAMSIESAGGQAIALHSATNHNKLIKEIKGRQKNTLPTLILALDNDEAGRTAQDKLKTALFDEGIIAIEAEPYGEGIKDANELLMKDRNALSVIILKGHAEATRWAQEQAEIDEQAQREAAEEYWRQHGAGSYLFGYMDEIVDRMSRPPASTGFPVLDAALGGGLRDGLIVFGAVSSLGKTTMALQMADYIAASGRDVLFFSLEQSKFEIVSKSISRLSYIRKSSSNKPVSHLELMDGGFTRYGADSKRFIMETMAEYQDTAGKKLAILEENQQGERFNVFEIRDAIKAHVDRTGNRPVVFVDYLQIIKPLSERATTKDNTDAAVTELRRISRAFKIPVFVISSLNRENYTMPINLTSFKESGGIEYSADVVLGLQVEGADEFAEKNKATNNAKVHQEKGKEVRALEVKILKQRAAKTPHTPFPIRFRAAYNYFEEGQQNACPT